MRCLTDGAHRPSSLCPASSVGLSVTQIARRMGLLELFTDPSSACLNCLLTNHWLIFQPGSTISKYLTVSYSPIKNCSISSLRLSLFKIHSVFNISLIGVSNEFYASLDVLKESCRIASSVNWSDVDLSQFQGLMESMRQADLKNWSLDQVQFADLCSSLNQFFTQTGLIHSQSNVQQNVCHGAMHPTKPSQHIGTGNLYIDSRQNLPPSVMPPPGYPHIPQALSTPGTTITGHHGAMNQQHMMPSQAFQMRRPLPPDDIQDDFDWDSIVQSVFWQGSRLQCQLSPR